MPEAPRSRSLSMRLVAVVVLLVAAYVLLRVVIGIVSGVFYMLVVVAALFAVVWAYRTVKRR